MSRHVNACYTRNIAAGIAAKAKKVRVAALLNVIGIEMPLTCMNHFSGKAKATTLKLEKSWRSLRCVVCQQESLVGDRLVYGIRDDQVREKLLGKRQLDLDKRIEISKSSELTHCQAKEISVDESQTNYVRRDTQKPNEGLKNKESGNVIKKHAKMKSKNNNKRQKEFFPTSEELKDCQFCGRCHQNKKEMCPAWGKRCRVCKKVGHFWKMCRSSKVHQVSQ